MPLLFQWNNKKSANNLSKHHVSFEEASTVFGDNFSITIADPLHSREEERWITIGYSSKNRMIVAIHTNRGNQIRIISARLATPRERKKYEENT
jgi:uncharacterized DUF497 family protein